MRRRIIDNLPERHTDEDIAELYNLQKGTCYYCFKTLDEIGSKNGFQIDRILPILRG
jgi:CRISPR/Cas system Type II protein with McrA/HNH and RuvC-like nuclease domain